jgi:cytosine permease
MKKTSFEDDFTNTEVPREQRTSGVDILFVWMGFILVVASMSFGGGLASQMSLDDFVKAVLIGNAILATLAFASGYIGSRSGLSFGSLAARVFPADTWRIAILYIPLSLIGWYAIEAAIFGNLIADTFDLNETARRLIMAGAALFFSVSAYFGMRFMGKVSYALVPIILVISLAAIFNIDSETDLQFGFGNTRIDIFTGISIVLSTWIFSVLLVVPDLTRFVKNPVVAGSVAAGGVFAANCIALGIGAFSAAYTRESDPSLILVSLGFTPLAILLSFAGIWSTNDNNMYSSALSVARALSLPRKRVVLALACIGAVIALFNPATIAIMFQFLIFMGASAPPLGGIVLGGYVFRAAGGNAPEAIFSPWIAWILASAVTFQISGVLVIPTGLALGFIFWIAFSFIENKLLTRRAV